MKLIRDTWLLQWRYTLQYLRNVCNHPALVLKPEHPLYADITAALKREGTEGEGGRGREREYVENVFTIILSKLAKQMHV